ncbi:ABC transporter permease [Terribacillus saccharophilus]|uniref:Peptide ABC transporter n=1 Tax=Terribacillus saccharophilus TaxID=361277 RepID=A0ABX4GWF4_9BACI|nr:ABC transporter permease [Terribacillus saccharophilus]PAD34883.1 peptide ABC transporter [Terribacillus saccharophilus]PAD95632.1 peptide ABC transporter [Terribacillus saccharophilus]PAD99209.1 peptide ABC transporter [Terribacillus saccharophilus]
MLNYTIRRLLSVIPVMLVVSIIVFLLVHLTPGNPAFIILGEDASPEAIAKLEEQLGLNEPLYIQFFDWIKQVITGDLGTSVYSAQPVTELIFGNFGPTISLMVLSLLFILVISIPLAILIVSLRKTILDPLFTNASLLGVSIPEFWLAILLVLGFGVTFPIFPVAGYMPLAEGFGPWIYHLLLPAFVLALVEIGIIARMLRDSMLDSVNQDYTKTARAKGVRERDVLMKHVFANALIPTTTVLGATVAGLLGGTVIIETLFTIPGIGQLLIDSIHRRDYPVIQGVVLFIAAIYVLVNLIVDLLYAFLDPRIRYD